MITLSIGKNFGKSIQAIAKKYPKAADMALRESIFKVHKESKEKFARIVDGSPITLTSANTRRFPVRTSDDGVRFVTGHLNAGIQTRFETKAGFAVMGAVGISSPFYGVEHERLGRKKVKGKYAFIWPAFKATADIRKKIFEAYFRAAQRSAK